MNPIYQARRWTPGQYRETVKQDDFEDEAEARKVVEEAGRGEVVKFARYQNLPGALPEIRHNSIWLESYTDGKWKKHNIFG